MIIIIIMITIIMIKIVIIKMIIVIVMIKIIMIIIMIIISLCLNSILKISMNYTLVLYIRKSFWLLERKIERYRAGFVNDIFVFLGI